MGTQSETHLWGHHPRKKQSGGSYISSGKDAPGDMLRPPNLLAPFMLMISQGTVRKFPG
jgi:hypothetical protein